MFESVKKRIARVIEAAFGPEPQPAPQVQVQPAPNPDSPWDHPNPAGLNIANINKVIDALKSDSGKHFRMCSFVEYTPDAMIDEDDPRIDEDGRPREYIECKTAFCLGGTANLIRMNETGVPWKTMLGEAFAEQFEDEDAAADWLGLQGSQPVQLFHMFSATDFDGSYRPMRAFDRLPDTVRRAAGIGVMTILRDEGMVDWDRAIRIAREQS